MGGGGGSQRLLSLNPTTVLVVLLLGLWLLLGCDNSYYKGIVLKNSKSKGGHKNFFPGHRHSQMSEFHSCIFI